MSEIPQNPIARVVDPLVTWMQILTGWALIGICLATVFDVIARKLFGYSLQGVNEVGAYLLAIVSSWGFSAALLQKAHSRVDFLFGYMPAPMQSFLNAFAAVTLSLLAVFSTYQAWTVLAESLRWESRASTPLQTPLWIPQSLWLFGLIVFAGISTACAIHAVWLLVKNRKRLDRFYGPPSIQEQIDIETQGVLPHESEGAVR